MKPEVQDVIRNEDGTYPPGVSGNPAGRPKGKSLKEFAREWYQNLSEDEKLEYIKKTEEKRPGFAWEMAEGKATQIQDLNVTPIELLVKIVHTDASNNGNSSGI